MKQKRSFGSICALAAALLVSAGAALIAQEGVNKRVRFAPGHSSTVVKNAVVRGTRDRYVVGAKTGQTMTVSIRALEHNAVFSIAQPGGKYLPRATEESDATKWSGKLPVSGDYVIEVGGTRGNANYSLTIAIK
jgi:hypothetical protein